MLIELDIDEIFILINCLKKCNKNLGSTFMVLFDDADTRYRIVREGKIAKNDIIIKKLNNALKK